LALDARSLKRLVWHSDASRSRRIAVLDRRSVEATARMKRDERGHHEQQSTFSTIPVLEGEGVERGRCELAVADSHVHVAV